MIINSQRRKNSQNGVFEVKIIKGCCLTRGMAKVVEDKIMEDRSQN